MEDYDFHRVTSEAEPSIIGFLVDLVKDERHKVSNRLKAADLLLSRIRPTLKSVEVKSSQQVNIFYMPAAELAKQVRSGVEIVVPPNHILEENISAELNQLPE